MAVSTEIRRPGPQYGLFNHFCRSSRPKMLFAMSIVVSTYFVYTAYLTVSRTTVCIERRRRDVQLEAARDSFRPFENGIVLEYTSFGDLCNKTGWKSWDCHNGSCTRVYVNGEIYVKTASNSSNSTTTAEPKRAASLVNNMLSSRSYELLSCEDIDRLWADPELKKFKPVHRTKPYDETIVVKKGIVTNFFSPNSYRVTIKEASANDSGYYRLHDEYKKRSQLGWNMRGLPRLFGACATNNYVRLVLEDTQGILLCYGQAGTSKNFSDSSCYKVSKINRVIAERSDQTRAALAFVQSILCFVGKLEKKRFFIEDIHGSNFLVQPDMSVILKDLDNVFYYGKRNIYGNSICIKDEDCPFPNGTKWFNGSANRVIYQKCHDLQPTCYLNRCVGFNASLHLCGFAHWILEGILDHMGNLQRKLKLSHLIQTISNAYAEVRASGDEACAQVTSLISLYEYDKMKGGSDQQNKSSFHIGLPPAQPDDNS